MGRKAVFAGRFYPADAGELRNAVERYIADAGDVKIAGKAIALVSPHAGYVFSGPVAGYAYAAVKDESFDTVVVVGSHMPAKGASVLDVDYYQTPLGNVRVDEEVVKRLLERPQFSFDPRRHGEHVIETQVPFLQVALKENFSIVAVALTDTEAEFVQEAALALAETLKGRKMLLVASTDLTHYPPYQDAKEIDGKILETLKTLDGDKILRREEELMREYARVRNLECVMCGKAAVAVVVETAKLLGADALEVLTYANSGDVPVGGKDSVVGYGAAVIYSTAK